jgi:hypothetical protein
MFVDLHRPRAIFGTEGRDAESFGRLLQDFEAHGGQPEQLTELCMDLARRAEQEVASTLQKSRYLWLTNPRRLSAAYGAAWLSCGASTARVPRRIA